MSTSKSARRTFWRRIALNYFIKLTFLLCASRIIAIGRRVGALPVSSHFPKTLGSHGLSSCIGKRPRRVGRTGDAPCHGSRARHRQPDLHLHSYEQIARGAPCPHAAARHWTGAAHGSWGARTGWACRCPHPPAFSAV